MTDPKRVEALFFRCWKRLLVIGSRSLRRPVVKTVELRQQVEQLLAAHPGVGSFLEQPAVAIGQPTRSEPISLRPSRPYRRRIWRTFPHGGPFSRDPRQEQSSPGSTS